MSPKINVTIMNCSHHSHNSLLDTRQVHVVYSKFKEIQRVSTQSSILYLKALFSKNCEIGSSKGFERLLPGPENSFYGPDNIITFAIQGLGAIGTINYVRYKYNTNIVIFYTIKNIFNPSKKNRQVYDTGHGDGSGITHFGKILFVVQ